MSTPTKQDPCIRGCTRPCACDECKAVDEPAHAPLPVYRKEGLLCGRCAGRLESWLTDVLDDTARLDTRKVQGGQGGKGKHQKISGSPSLVRLEVVALTDPRTMRDDNDGRNEPLNIPGVMCSWALLLTEEHDIEAPVKYMAQAVSLLRAWWDTLVTELWVDEFFNDMQQIRRLLNNALMVERPEPVGHCLSVYEVKGKMVSCARPIYARGNDAVAKCPRCGRVYRGLDFARMKVAEGK